MEGGTLLQLKNLINRRNVCSGTEIKHQVNEVEDFLELVIRGHMIAAAVHFFNMSDESDSPHSSAFPSDIARMDVDRRSQLLHAKMEEIIDKYVLPHQLAASISTSEKDLASDLTGVSTSTDLTTPNPHLARIQRDHDYLSPVTLPKKSRGLPRVVREAGPRLLASQSVLKAAPDGVYNYASAVLNDGLLLLEFKDAIREGDGERILRVWKVLIIYFHYAGHKNYKLEAFNLLTMVNATASPRIAAQLTWSRVVNTRGKKGHNVAADLHMEHLNKVVKGCVANLGANISEQTIVQCGKSLSGLIDICKHFDKENNVTPSSVEHSYANSAEDMRRILVELTSTSRVFDYIPGREHKTFKRINSNVARSIDAKKLLDWLQTMKKKYQDYINLFKAYGHNL